MLSSVCPRRLLISCLLVTLVGHVVHVASANDFKLIILHTNDMHSNFEPVTAKNKMCSVEDDKAKKCFGGFARVAYEAKRIRKEAADNNGPSVLFLNAGDTFQGTPWYNVLKWEVVVKLTSMLGLDAASLGNHEFDDGVAGLVPFINHASFPVLAANVDSSKEPELQASNLTKSVVLTVDGHQIGIIGYVLPETKEMADTGDVIFSREVESINKEAIKLKQQGVKILIALGHSGYPMDKIIAAEAPDIDVVVGGHTNTFLYTGTPPDLPIKLAGEYPTMIDQPSGRKVPVVQAERSTKFLGKLTVTFDESGEVTRSEGNPILLDHKIQQDRDVMEELEQWRPKVEERTKKIIGSTRVFLNTTCYSGECNLGNLVTDAMLDYYVTNNPPPSDGWSDVTIAVIHDGALRIPIEPDINGNGTQGAAVTQGDVYVTMPFDNSIAVMRIKGEHLLGMLEWGIHGYKTDDSMTEPGGFLQVAGLQVNYDLCRPLGHRVVSASALCSKCLEPKYESMDPAKEYGVLVSVFIANGGDGFTFKNHTTSYKVLPVTDQGVLSKYITKISPVYTAFEGRITVLKGPCDARNAAGHLKSNCLIIVLVITQLAIANDFYIN